MRRWRGLLLAGALVLASCGRTDWPEPTPALWQVTSPDGDTGWLLGTVHSLPDGVEWQTPLISRAFEQADLLLVEIAELEDAGQSAATFNQLATLQHPAPLLARFAGDDRRWVQALLAQADTSEDDFADQETWAAALLLSNIINTGDSALGVDRQLLASDKPVAGLESYHSQFALFDALPEGEQQDLLLAVACEAAAAQDTPDAGVTAWLTGDLAALEQLGEQCLLGDPELRAALLDGRNMAWIEPIIASIDEGERPFVAVGAAHILGDNGLPALLAARGYRVERIQ